MKNLNIFVLLAGFFLSTGQIVAMEPTESTNNSASNASNNWFNHTKTVLLSISDTAQKYLPSTETLIKTVANYIPSLGAFKTYEVGIAEKDETKRDSNKNDLPNRVRTHNRENHCFVGDGEYQALKEKSSQSSNASKIISLSSADKRFLNKLIKALEFDLTQEGKSVSRFVFVSDDVLESHSYCKEINKFASEINNLYYGKNGFETLYDKKDVVHYWRSQGFKIHAIGKMEGILKDLKAMRDQN